MVEKDKEYKLGEVVNTEFGSTIVEEVNTIICCDDCVFVDKSIEFCDRIKCLREERSDKTDIFFKAIDNGI